jgi:hypothetical protein
MARQLKLSETVRAILKARFAATKITGDFLALIIYHPIRLWILMALRAASAQSCPGFWIVEQYLKGNPQIQGLKS